MSDEPELLGEPKFEEIAGEREKKNVWPIANMRHENRWETTKLSCRHMDKSKPEKLVNGKTHRERSNKKWLEPKWLRRREGGGGRGGSRGFQWLPAERGSGMVPEMWDKPLWKGVCPYWDPWEGGWTRALHPSRNSESMCLDRSPHCPKSPVWSSGGDECAGSEDTSSFEDYEHNVGNLALEAFLSTWTGYDFWGEGCVGRNGVREIVEWVGCLILRFLLQFEHGVPSSEWGCSLCSFVCLLDFVYSSECRKEALPPFGSFVATNGRMVFLTFDVCTWCWCAPFICWSVGLALVTVVFFLSHKAPTQKPPKIKRRSS